MTNWPKWEYVTYYLCSDVMEKELERLGSAGWELVTASWEHTGFRAIFKRPKT